MAWLAHRNTLVVPFMGDVDENHVVRSGASGCTVYRLNGVPQPNVISYAGTNQRESKCLFLLPYGDAHVSPVFAMLASSQYSLPTPPRLKRVSTLTSIELASRTSTVYHKMDVEAQRIFKGSTTPTIPLTLLMQACSDGGKQFVGYPTAFNTHARATVRSVPTIRPDIEWTTVQSDSAVQSGRVRVSISACPVGTLFDVVAEGAPACKLPYPEIEAVRVPAYATIEAAYTTTDAAVAAAYGYVDLNGAPVTELKHPVPVVKRIPMEDYTSPLFPTMLRKMQFSDIGITGVYSVAVTFPIVTARNMGLWAAMTEPPNPPFPSISVPIPPTVPFEVGGREDLACVEVQGPAYVSGTGWATENDVPEWNSGGRLKQSPVVMTVPPSIVVEAYDINGRKRSADD